MDNPMWYVFFDERQLKEIKFNKMYAEFFHHGTDGHNLRMIVARMAKVLDEIENQISELGEIPEEKYKDLLTKYLA
jgi:hypothetical protein